MARDNSLAQSTYTPACSANSAGYRRYGLVRHYLLFRHLLSFWRRGCLVLVISKLLCPGIMDETAQLGRRKGRKLQKDAKLFKENKLIWRNKETLTSGQMPFSYMGIFSFKGSSRPTLMMLRIQSSISSADSSSLE
jgi:hypothetical protein